MEDKENTSARLNEMISGLDLASLEELAELVEKRIKFARLASGRVETGHFKIGSKVSFVAKNGHTYSGKLLQISPEKATLEVAPGDERDVHPSLLKQEEG